MEIEHAGVVRKRQADGTFHVPDALGKSMVRSGQCVAVGISLATIDASGFVCQDCGRVNVFRGPCGKCGSTNVEKEAA